MSVCERPFGTVKEVIWYLLLGKTESTLVTADLEQLHKATLVRGKASDLTDNRADLKGDDQSLPLALSRSLSLSVCVACSLTILTRLLTTPLTVARLVRGVRLVTLWPFCIPKLTPTIVLCEAGQHITSLRLASPCTMLHPLPPESVCANRHVRFQKKKKKNLAISCHNKNALKHMGEPTAS